MHFSQEKTDNYTILKVLADKLDSLIAPDLKAEFILLNNEGANNIILDLSQASYCDSSGLSSILVGNRLCSGAKGTLVISGLQPAVKKLMSISQLESVLRITPTISEAVDYLFMEAIEKDLNDQE